MNRTFKRIEVFYDGVHEECKYIGENSSHEYSL